VGVWSVMIPELVASRGLSPAALGGAVALLAGTSIASLAASGPLADRVGRRPLAVAGAAGFAASFALLAGVEARAALWPTMALYGVSSGALDVAANAVGADFERAHRTRAMIRLHAGFSAAAAIAALAAAVIALAADHRTTYAATAALYVILALAAARAPLPPHEVARGEGDVAPGEDEVAAGEGDVAAPGVPVGVTPSARFALLRIPAILVAVGLITLCFFGDGAIEAYVALYLRDDLGSGLLLTGVALAAYHGASLAGRLTFARLADERRALTLAGLGAAAGMTVTVAASAPAVAAAGMLAVGFALSPIVPTALSIAGRSAPGRSASAVALVTTVGYSAFVLGPPLTGLLAQATSLRVALVPVIASAAAIAALARLTQASRTPRTARRRPGTSTR